jgi:GNAT superfamily N-acetyltransferase
MEPLLLDLALARRIEQAEAQAGAAACALLARNRPSSFAAVERIAGGYALYAGPGSPVTQAVGLGLDGAISEADFAQLESFYQQKNEPVRAEVCPLADPALFRHLGAGGYRVTEFSNVMACRLPGFRNAPKSADGIEITRVKPAQIDLWNLTVAQGFAGNGVVGVEILEVMKGFGLAVGVECYLASIDGHAAGGATLSVRDQVAGLFGASTLLAFRNRGVQTALLLARLQRAEELGCDLAACLAQPGSSSQRNIVRQGFQVLYTRVKFEKP